MKLVLVVVLSMMASLSHAKSKVDFNRDTASSQKTVGLSQAFKNAIQGSDADLQKTKTSLVVEDHERQAKWHYRTKKKIVIQGTAAVDSNLVQMPMKKIVKESQIDTQQSIQEELTDLN